MTALQTVADIRAELLTMIGAASDNALDDSLSGNDRRVFVVISALLSDLLGKIASVDTFPKGQDAKQGLAGTEGSAVPKAGAQNVSA